MADDLHTIRFKRSGTEFEMTGSRDDVRRAWTTLEAAVVAAFAHTTANGHGNGDDPAEHTGETKTTAKRRSRRQNQRASSTDERADVAGKLVNTSLNGFPKLGSKPSARFAAYAALGWARSKAGIDG